MLKEIFDLLRKESQLKQAFDRSLEMLEVDQEMFLAATSSLREHDDARIDIDIFANGSGRTVIDVELTVGDGGLNPTSLRLGASDSLVATANGIQQTLTEDSSIFGEYSYFTTFDFADDNTVFTVAFVRANGTNAPNSSVALPEGFTISSPRITDTFGTDPHPSGDGPAGSASP